MPSRRALEQPHVTTKTGNGFSLTPQSDMMQSGGRRLQLHALRIHAELHSIGAGQAGLPAPRPRLVYAARPEWCQSCIPSIMALPRHAPSHGILACTAAMHDLTGGRSSLGELQPSWFAAPPRCIPMQQQQITVIISIDIATPQVTKCLSIALFPFQTSQLFPYPSASFRHVSRMGHGGNFGTMRNPRLCYWPSRTRAAIHGPYIAAIDLDHSDIPGTQPSRRAHLHASIQAYARRLGDSMCMQPVSSSYFGTFGRICRYCIVRLPRLINEEVTALQSNGSSALPKT